MGTGLVVAAPLAAFGVIQLVIGLILGRRRTARLRRITARTMGTVSGYDFLGEGRVHPVVDFVLGSEVFQAKLKYRNVVRISGSFIRGSEVTSDPLAKTLKIRENSRVSRTRIPEIFPLGSALEVHYNPADPRENFAVRDHGSVAAPLLIWMGAGFTVLAVVLGVSLGVSG